VVKSIEQRKQARVTDVEAIMDTAGGRP